MAVHTFKTAKGAQRLADKMAARWPTRHAIAPFEIGPVGPWRGVKNPFDFAVFTGGAAINRPAKQKKESA